MYSFSFPNMLSSARSSLIEDHNAIKSNLILLLSSDKTSLFGDPFFGTDLKRFIFEQNNKVIKDLIIDEIYEDIITFMPQVYLNRNDIVITTDGVDIFANIKCTYYLDQKSDLYVINLTNVKEV